MTSRQIEILKAIVEEYIQTGQPVASAHFTSQPRSRRWRFGALSSATIRGEMFALEKDGYLQKAHASSGRIPTTKGYQHYAQNVATESNDVLLSKLQDVFARRRISIDLALDQAAKAISQVVGMTLVTSTHPEDELMKSIWLTPIDHNLATIVVVTSTGRVESKILEFSENLSLNDVRIAVRLFKERLADTPLKQLSSKVAALAPLLAKSVKHYEELIATFVGKIFDFHHHISNKVYGNWNLVKSTEIKREDLAKLLDMIENKSIWSSIEGKLSDEENLKIAVRPDNISIISKKIHLNNTTKEISIVGSNRLNYQEARTAIKLLERF
ncbi:heat-inducible transcriptional repressor HrcA [Mycoplasma sp. ATU-Cv-508]